MREPPITPTPGLNAHANTVVSVSISNPSATDGRDDGYVLLTVEDWRSGEVLCRVEIPAGRFHRLHLGTQMTFNAFVSQHLERVGKSMEVTSVHVSRERLSDDDALALVHDLDAWESSSVRHTNRGTQVVLRRWSSDG